MKIRSTVLVLLLVMVLPLPALAFVPRAGDVVVVAESIRDDLYASGGSVEVSGDVDGDVVAAGGTVTLTGPVTGGVLAAGGNVNIRGAVGRTLRAAAGTLSVGGPVGADAVLAGGNVLLEQAAVVGRDLVAAGGNVQVSGTVRDDAFLAGGTVTIAGTIQGSVEAHADQIVLLPTARIAGALRYSADRPLVIPSGAQVAGEVTRMPRPAGPQMGLARGMRFGVPYGVRLLEILWLLALGLVAVAVAPRGVQRVGEQVGRRFGMNLLTGFILLVVVPVAATVLLITLVGIPLAAAVMLLYFATLYPAQVFVSAWLGSLIMGRLARARTASAYLTMTIGVILLIVLVALPYVGWVFRFVALLAGFGALWAAVWSARVPT